MGGRRAFGVASGRGRLGRGLSAGSVPLPGLFVAPLVLFSMLAQLL